MADSKMSPRSLLVLSASPSQHYHDARVGISCLPALSCCCLSCPTPHAPRPAALPAVTPWLEECSMLIPSSVIPVVKENVTPSDLGFAFWSCREKPLSPSKPSDHLSTCGGSFPTGPVSPPGTSSSGSFKDSLPLCPLGSIGDPPPKAMAHAWSHLGLC